jgi:UDP-N-acetylmuramoylalanine--D-glutamate ligase
MNIERSPQVTIVTSFFPEHLDYHGSLENYQDAKKHICKFQSKEDTVFYFEKSEGAKEIADTSPGKKVSYGENDSPIAIIDTNLVGAHNLFNVAGAAMVARHLGVDDAVIIEATRKFEGLPHRLKDLGKHHNITWVDDAISTTPESTIAAIRALSPKVKTIIVGGQDRGSDFTQLGEVIMASGIENVILLGESGPRIGDTISGPETVVHEAPSMQEAVNTAKSETPTGSICLLSPGSPSFGMFKDFEEKGDLFASLVNPGQK